MGCKMFSVGIWRHDLPAKGYILVGCATSVNDFTVAIVAGLGNCEWADGGGLIHDPLQPVSLGMHG